MKAKILALSALALLGLGSGTAVLVHAQSPSTTPPATTQQIVTSTTPDIEVPDANEPKEALDPKDNQGTPGVDADGPNGHQDPEGVDVQGQGGK